MTRLIRPILLASVLGASVWYVATHLGDFGLLLEVDLRYLPGLIAVHVASVFVNGWIIKVLLDRLGIHLRFVEWFGLTVLHAFGNYLPIPQAGSVARGVYLNRRHGLGYAPFLAVLAVAYTLFLVAAGLTGCLTLAVLATQRDVAPWPLWVIFAGLLLGAVAAFPLARRAVFRARLVPFADAISSLKGARPLLLVAALQLALIVAVTAGLWFSFAALRETVPAPTALLVALASTASAIANITPGNVGVAEASAWLVARFVGADADRTVVAYALFRLSAVLTVLAMAPPFATRLTRGVGGASGSGDTSPRP